MLYYNRSAPETQDDKDLEGLRSKPNNIMIKRLWTPKVLLLTNKLIFLCSWAWIIWCCAPIVGQSDPDALFEVLFYAFGIVYVGVIFAILFLQPFTPAKSFKSYALRNGRTKIAIEEVAKQLHFPLKDVYAQEGLSANSRISKAEVLIWGFPWLKSIAITQLVLEKCNTDDVAAIIVQEIGSWKNNSLKQALTLILVSTENLGLQ